MYKRVHSEETLSSRLPINDVQCNTNRFFHISAHIQVEDNISAIRMRTEMHTIIERFWIEKKN